MAHDRTEATLAEIQAALTRSRARLLTTKHAADALADALRWKHEAPHLAALRRRDARWLLNHAKELSQ